MKRHLLNFIIVSNTFFSNAPFERHHTSLITAQCADITRMQYVTYSVRRLCCTAGAFFNKSENKV